MRRAVAGCAFGAALLPAFIAGAEPREARLEYARGAGAERCPDEATLRSAVSTRLGYDPFRTAAPRTISASIARAGRSLRAEVKLLDASGAVTGSRELMSSQNDCSELLGAVALAISIAIDPQSDLRDPSPAPRATPEALSEAPASSPKAPPEAPASSAAPSPEASASSTEARPPRPASRPAAPAPSPASRPAAPASSPANAPQPTGLRAHAGIAGLVTFGTAPGVSLGLSALLGLRLGAASIDVEGRTDLRASEESASGGVVSSALLLGTLATCYHDDPLLACVLISAGVLRGEGSLVEEPREATTPFVAAGGRIGAELFEASRFSARFYIDVTATLTPTRLELNGLEVWRTAPVGVAAGIAGLVHFP